MPPSAASSGNFAAYCFDHLGPASGLPTVLQVDLDRLDQRQPAQRRRLGRHEVGQGGGSAAFCQAVAKASIRSDNCCQTIDPSISVDFVGRLRHPVPFPKCASPERPDPLPNTVSISGSESGASRVRGGRKRSHCGRFADGRSWAVTAAKGLIKVLHTARVFPLADKEWLEIRPVHLVMLAGRGERFDDDGSPRGKRSTCGPRSGRSGISETGRFHESQFRHKSRRRFQ